MRILISDFRSSVVSNETSVAAGEFNCQVLYIFISLSFCNNPSQALETAALKLFCLSLSKETPPYSRSSLIFKYDYQIDCFCLMAQIQGSKTVTKYESVKLLKKENYLLVQTDKGQYKAKDTVKFRVLALDHDLRLPA